MSHLPSRRRALLGLGGLAQVAVLQGLEARADPAAPPQRLTATEIGCWRAPEANQGVAVDATHFYGIGNRVLVKHHKATGERVQRWASPRGDRIVHFNSGYVDGSRLVLSHSNYPHLPSASSLEIHDTGSLAPVERVDIGTRPGSLTWAVRRGNAWWACLAYYNGWSSPGPGQRATYVGEFDDQWRMQRSWLFPPQVIARWGDRSCSGGDWGDDGLLYTTGHDAPALHVLRLPREGGTLDYVATINVPFAGQGWAWDRSRTGERVIYGIRRARQQVIAARIPPVQAQPS